jgi:hypothetical protein
MVTSVSGTDTGSCIYLQLCLTHIEHNICPVALYHHIRLTREDPTNMIYPQKGRLFSDLLPIAWAMASIFMIWKAACIVTAHDILSW